MKKRTVEQIGLALVTTSIIGMSLLLYGCGESYSTRSEARVPLDPNAQQAVANINKRGGGWLQGVNGISQEDRPPTGDANWAAVDCPGTVILFNTTRGKPVEWFERLLVHEAHEIWHHDCKDRDSHTGDFVRCYSEGRSYAECVREVG